MARAQLGAEQGGVLVMTAVWLPVLLLFASFVIDIGNFFEHQRHLQTQVDAGALAGGDVYQFPCDNTAITNDSAGNGNNSETGHRIDRPAGETSSPRARPATVTPHPKRHLFLQHLQ